MHQAGEEREAEPGEVEQRREEVVAEQQQAVGVEQLRDLRVEPVEVERVDEEQLGDRAASAAMWAANGRWYQSESPP